MPRSIPIVVSIFFFSFASSPTATLTQSWRRMLQNEATESACRHSGQIQRRGVRSLFRVRVRTRKAAHRNTLEAPADEEKETVEPLKDVCTTCNGGDSKRTEKMMVFLMYQEQKGAGERRARMLPRGGGESGLAPSLVTKRGGREA